MPRLPIALSLCAVLCLPVSALAQAPAPLPETVPPAAPPSKDALPPPGSDDATPAGTAQPHGACVPATCESKGRTCGLILDGCGEIVDCGVCPDQGASWPAQALRRFSDFVDTRINFTITDENLLVKPG